jgi:hypothetical protein
MSDGPIDERLLTMTELHPSRRDDHSLDSGRRQEGSVAMSENLPACVPKDMGRRSTDQCLTGPAITPFLLAAEAIFQPSAM